jgi:hypothetical protein
MNGKKAMRKFMLHVGSAPEGAHFEIGKMWDARKGWRVYQRIGEKALAMSSDSARGLWAQFEKQAKLPEWRSAAEDLRESFEGLKALADEVDQLNAAGAVPEGAPNVSSHVGHA